MQTFFQDLWATLRIAYSNFNARYGALFNFIVFAVIVFAITLLISLCGILVYRHICRKENSEQSNPPVTTESPRKE